MFLALFKDWSGVLKPGERGTILIIASDRKQGRVIMGYIKGLISGDVANAAAGALLLAKQAMPVEMWVLGDQPLNSGEMDPHEFVERWYAGR